jgi:hypothetical protein
VAYPELFLAAWLAQSPARVRSDNRILSCLAMTAKMAITASLVGEVETTFGNRGRRTSREDILLQKKRLETMSMA